MGEGMHLTMPQPEQPGQANQTPTSSLTAATSNRTSAKLWMLLAGTGLALLAGAIGLQSMQATPGQAAAEPTGTARVTPNKKPVEALARVGKEIISYDMVAEECVSRHGKEILDDLINRMVIQQACEAQNINVSEEEVTVEVNRIAKRFNLDAPAWYQMLQAERNITPQQYRQSIIWPALALKKLAGGQIELTEEEIEKAFVRNYGERVKLRMIMLDNRRRATDLWDKVHKDPDNFDKYAQEHSIDPNSRALGGAVPPVPRFTGSPEVEAAAFKLKEGEISGVIEIGANRFVILKGEGRTVPTVTDIGEVREALYEELLETKTQTAVAEVFQELKKQARVDNYLTSTTSGPDRALTPGAPIQPTSKPAPQQAAGAAKATRK
jgi:foldase protein PrsA